MEWNRSGLEDGFVADCDLFFIEVHVRSELHKCSSLHQLSELIEIIQVLIADIYIWFSIGLYWGCNILLLTHPNISHLD